VRVLGVDPGGFGALALLTREGLTVSDMPVFMVRRGKTDKPEMDVHSLIELLAMWQPDVCYFEQIGGQTDQSAPAAFNFGRITGACEALVKSCGAKFVPVTPQRWKRAMKVRGKDDARAMATNMWPANAADFRLKKHLDRAEAALLAEYGRQQENITGGIFG
jgi:hypothetical protein